MIYAEFEGLTAVTEEYCLLGCDLQFCRRSLTYQKNILPPSSGLKSKSSIQPMTGKQQAEILLFAWLTLLSWRQKQYFSLKCWWISNGLHTVTPQKTVLLFDLRPPYLSYTVSMKTIYCVVLMKWKGRGSGHGLLDILLQHFPGRVKERTWKPSVRFMGVPAKIWIEHLPNTSPETYHRSTCSVSAIVLVLAYSFSATYKTNMYWWHFKQVSLHFHTVQILAFLPNPTYLSKRINICSIQYIRHTGSWFLYWYLQVITYGKQCTPSTLYMTDSFSIHMKLLLSLRNERIFTPTAVAV